MPSPNPSSHRTPDLSLEVPPPPSEQGIRARGPSLPPPALGEGARGRGLSPAPRQLPSPVVPPPTSGEGARGRGLSPAPRRDSSHAISPPSLGEGSGERSSPREHAFALYCRGLRSPAIAARLGLPERTIRRWLRAIRADVAFLRHADRAAELTRAIESQRAVVAAAWDAYERERQIEDVLLAGHYDRLRRRAYYPSTANVDADSPSPCGARGPGGEETLYEDFERPHRLNLGARYLTVIVAAQREIARLQGLNDLLAEQPPTDIQITITRRPDGPENLPPESRLRPIAPVVTSADEEEDQ